MSLSSSSVDVGAWTSVVIVERASRFSLDNQRWMTALICLRISAYNAKRCIFHVSNRPICSVNLTRHLTSVKWKERLVFGQEKPHLDVPLR